jgi:hypothetical protein
MGATALTDLEKTFFVMTSADRAFDRLSDPARLPDYVPAIRLEESTAVEGELDLDADIAERAGAPQAGFTADRATRRIEWGAPSPAYGGSIEIVPGTASTATVTLRLHTRDEADQAEVTRIFEQSINDIRRVLSER